MSAREIEVVLASANPGKQRELAGLLEPFGLRLRLAADFGLASAAETGLTFQDNALLKARHAAAATGLAALADDSGLAVDALDGRPGVCSARYAGSGASDEDNNTRLLIELADRSPRTARYQCVLVLLRGPDDGAPLLASGSWEGRIAEHAAGHGGFGYDPLFIPEGCEQTVAQLPLAFKQQHSHRARAARALVAQLRSAAPWL